MKLTREEAEFLQECIERYQRSSSTARNDTGAQDLWDRLEKIACPPDPLDGPGLRIVLIDKRTGEVV